MENIKTYPFIQERIRQKKLRIHGWWFDIASVNIYCYQKKINRFIEFDESNLMSL